MTHSIFRYTESKVPVRFLVRSCTTKSVLKRNNLWGEKKRSGTYQLRDGITEAMTKDEMTYGECVEYDEQKP